MQTSFAIGLTLASVFALSGAMPLQTAPPNDYRDGRNWLCRPGRQDACVVDLTTTIVAANGTLSREDWKANPNPPIDCFYVYPTVSLDAGGNSDMSPGPEERGAVQMQFARFGSECRLFAPLYRQATLKAIGSMTQGPPVADWALAYNDVLSAWNDYLQHDNNGRGVVLIGHSQGSILLTQLIKNEVDSKPVLSRLVSALLPGTSLPVPKGKDVGGAFQRIPLCHTPGQISCAISYASFRATTPPPEKARFGHVESPGMVAACVNPASPGGGSAPLHAYLSTSGRGVAGLSAAPKPWVTPPVSIITPFVSVPGLLSAQCVATDQTSYLAVSVHSDPKEARVRDISGDVLLPSGLPDPMWGLHVVDVGLTLGNLIDVVNAQAKAYAAVKKTP